MMAWSAPLFVVVEYPDRIAARSAPPVKVTRYSDKYL